MVAVETNRGARLRVKRAMRVRITMSTSSRGETMDKRRERNYDQELNKHEWTKD